LHERVWVDLRSFEQLQHDALVLEAAGRSAFKLHQTMTTLYQGSFLDGVVLGDSAEFDTWLTITRERFHEAHIRALRALALAYRARGQWPDVVNVARIAVTQDALQEPMYRALMEAYAQMGDRATALRQYNSLRETLDRELGVTPLPETDRLRKEILLGRLSHKHHHGHHTPSQVHTVPSARDSSPFIGREQEMQMLDVLWATACGGQACVVLISGEVGVGKSRLWQRWSVRLEPATTLLTTRCLPTTQSLPLAPLADLLRSPVGRHRLKRLAGVTPPIWVEDILQLVPDLREELPAPSQPPALPVIEEQRRLFEALVQSLGIIPDHRVVFVIDDLHWADQATIEWLGYLMHRCHDLPLLLVGTFRPEEADPALVGLAAYWGREGLLQRMPLVRLNREEAYLLVSALDGDLQRADLLYEQSDGNPYFLIELLRAEPGAMPAALTDLIALRLDTLPGAARQVLQSAAVLQPEIDIALLYHISGHADEATTDAIEALVKAGLLREHQGRYEFGHPLIAHVVDTEMSRARKTLLHRRVAEALEQLAAERPAEVSGQLARHFREAGDANRAAHYAELAGDRALNLAAPVEAANFYEQALALSPTPTRYYGLGLARRLQADLEGADTAFTQALRMCDQQGERTIAARLCLELARICLAHNQFDEIVPWVQRARAYHRFEDAPLPSQALAAYLLGGHLRGTGQSLDEAATSLNEALLIAIRGDMTELLPGILLELGNVVAQLGDLTSAIRCFNELIALAHTIGDYFHEALGCNCLAHYALLVGDMVLAQHAIDEGLALANTRSVHVVYQWLYSTRGEIALAECHWQEAETWLMRGIVEAERFGNGPQIATYHANLGLVARACGRLDDAVGMLQTARAQAATAPAKYLLAEIDLHLTALYLERGEVATATQTLSQLEEWIHDSDYLRLRELSQQLHERLTA